MSKSKGFCPTGFKELDSVLEGGIPRGGIVLLIGPPGSGKTIFAASFLYDGATRFGEKTTYIGIVQSKHAFFENMKRLGMDFEELERKGLFQYIEFVPQLRSEFAEMFLVSLINSIQELKIDRLVIDSLSPILWTLTSHRTRLAFYTSLYRALRLANTTSMIVVDETIEKNELNELLHLADGVIEFVVDRREGFTYRRLRISKLHGRSVPPFEIPYTIIEGVGLRLLIPPKTVSSFDVNKGLNLISPTLQQAVGVIPWGSQILVLSSPRIPPSNALTMYMLLLPVLNKARTVFISFSRPVEHLLRIYERALAENPRLAGLNTSKLLKDLVLFQYINPAIYTLPDIMLKIWDIIERERAKLVILHGIKTLMELHKHENVYRYMIMNSMNMRSRRVTVVRKLEVEDIGEAIPITEFSDIVLQIAGTSTSDCTIRVLRSITGRNGAEVPCTMPLYEIIENETISKSEIQG